MKKNTLLIILVFILHLAYGQREKPEFKQTLKGTIYDSKENTPLNGVNVYIENDQTAGTITDSLGHFSLQYKTGRHTVIVSIVGYEKQSIPVSLNTIQEYVIDVRLEPDVQTLSEVVVKAPFQKEKPINNLVYSSGRSFSTEEANRYAGSLGDVARMVRSYAGVVPYDDNRNDIIIRGNSPTGLLWRVDGIEIPNPNHYGAVGLTGSTTTLLNTNMMSNSDFITGAFPAEYGNMLSGVFDLKMKTVNPDEYGFRFGTGWNGFEFGAEGPFSKKYKNGTFQACYRYSFLEVMDKIGINMGILPEFQDFTLKTEVKLNEKLTLSVLGLWGTSFIELNDKDREPEEIKSPYGQIIKTGSDMLLGGITLNYQLNSKTLFLLNVSANSSVMASLVDTFNLPTGNTIRIYNSEATENKYSLFAQIENRSVKNNFLKVGFRWDLYVVNYFQEEAYDYNPLETTIDSRDNMHLLRFYVQDQYNFSTKLKATLGVHSQFLLLNNTYAIEPRAGLQYRITNRQRLGVGYGNHHQMQVRNLYFDQTYTPGGIVLTNKNLDFTAANHFCLTYDWYIAKNLRIKADAYYQALSKIPIENDTNSSFSMSNVGAGYYIDLRDSLVNKGKGRNYGVEFTLEKFMGNNYYYMVNGTVFKSEYTGGDGIWRSTAFDMQYIFNGVAGYEWWLANNIALGADLKTTYSGGMPYVPVDEQASIARQEVVYDDAHAYSKRYNNYFRLDLRFYMKINYRKLYYEFAMDLQNISNYKNIYYQEYIPSTGEYNTYYQMGFFPMATFKLLF